MKPPLSIRHFTDEERAALEAGRRRHDACSMRRCQIVCASAAGQKPTTIATTWRGAPQTGRHVIHTCDARGLACHILCRPRPTGARAHLRPCLRARQPGAAGMAPGPPSSSPAGRGRSHDGLPPPASTSLAQSDGAHVGAGETGRGGPCLRALQDCTHAMGLCLLEV
jgi:hypothetical protein